jgi:hypothetical protein
MLPTHLLACWVAFVMWNAHNRKPRSSTSVASSHSSSSSSLLAAWPGAVLSSAASVAAMNADASWVMLGMNSTLAEFGGDVDETVDDALSP